MAIKNIERNKLDFILSDLIPYEVSSLLNYYDFYIFINKKDNIKTLNKLVNECNTLLAKNQELFKGGWDTSPLKYNIIKNNNSYRRMSLIQPLSMINIYLFMELYQKDIMNYFDKNNSFSIRYHTKNNSLYYKSNNSMEVAYFSKIKSTNEKIAIQQSGDFFSIKPYNSIISFTNSDTWRMSNLKYRNYAKIDYKSCFNSIYTHSYKWIIHRNVIDSKASAGSNLFKSIDKLLQNINGKCSNGLIVGPEFSRMIAEILLQEIDKNAILELSKKEILYKKHYVAFRYVDDIYIFANTQEILDKVINCLSNCSNKYMISLNDTKLEKGETPFLPKEWINKAKLISDKLTDCFYTKDEYKDNIDKHIIKTNLRKLNEIKDDVNFLIKKYPSNKNTIISYLLSTLFNNISIKKDNYILFNTNNKKSYKNILDIVFYIYCFNTSYDQTRKVISIISFIDSEVDIKNNIDNKSYLSYLIQKYYFIFKSENIYDLIDWFIVLKEYKINLPLEIEVELKRFAESENNPILWANLLIYSQYNNNFYHEIITSVNKILLKNLSKINNKDCLLYEEYWYVLIFCNCPFINDKNIINLIDNKISYLNRHDESPSSISKKLIYSYLKSTNSGFFKWKNNDNFSSLINFRTYQRTIFKNFKHNGFSSSIF